MKGRTTIILAIVLGSMLAVCGCELAALDTRPEYPSVDTARAVVDARTVLLQEANSSDPAVRAHAMEAIGQTMGQDGAGVLMQALGDKYTSVRFAAAMALGDVGYPPAKAKLIQIVENPQADQRVVCAAVYALHSIGHTKYAGQLGYILFGNFDLGRAVAAQVMGKMDETSAIGPLQAALEDEQNVTVRISIVEALALLGVKRSQEILEAYARGYFLDVRLVAIPALARSRAERAELVLEELVATDNPPRVRVSAAGGLGLRGIVHEEGYEFCLRAADNPRQVMRDLYGQDTKLKDHEVASLQRLATLALGQIKAPSSVGLLHHLLNAEDGSVRVAAAMSLLQICAPAVERMDSASPTAPESTPSRTRGTPERPGMQRSEAIESWEE